MHSSDFLPQVLNYAARLLTQLDRDPLSPTYGCFDRNHWHYKIRDFSSMVLQQNILSLALLYKSKFQGNSYFKSPQILELTLASIAYWSRAQHSNGGFDEYWPNESGYPPLVFSTHSVLRAIILLNLDKNIYKGSLDKAIQQICTYQERHALNQEAAGVLCLYYYQHLYKDEQVQLIFEKRLNDLLARQSSEGWFPEYGGADIGYSSVFLNYLSELVGTAYESRVLEPLKRQLDFLQHFIHPDGTMGGEYGSRNTEYFLLAGLARMHKHSTAAEQILTSASWSLTHLDDRYLFHYIFHSFIEGHHLLSKTILKPIKPDEIVRYFEESGLLVRRSRSTYFVTNMKKGGVFKLYSGTKLIFKCGGYRIKSGTDYLVTNWLSDTSAIMYDTAKAQCTTQLYVNSYHRVTPFRHVVLRIIATLPFKQNIIGILKKQLIHQNKQSDITFSRTFSFSKSKVSIVDQFNSEGRIEAFWSQEGSLRFVPSSKFFDSASLNLTLIPSWYEFNPNKVRRWSVDYA